MDGVTTARCSRCHEPVTVSNKCEQCGAAGWYIKLEQPMLHKLTPEEWKALENEQ